MKQILSALLLPLLIFSACSSGTGGGAAPQTVASTEPGEYQYTLALITDYGSIDDKSFNEAAWDGLAQYAGEYGISHKLYRPESEETDAYLAAIDLAVQNGAELVVLPGYLFEQATFIAQERYPAVHFVLLDGVPHDAAYAEYTIAENTVAIAYAEEQAGFLAGYAAIHEGLTRLGFMGGMPIPAVVRFGYGFLQGAEYAAHELELDAGAVSVVYHYTGHFDASDDVYALADAWYRDGTQVIFACGGAVGTSVMAAAESAGGLVIGVDKDQSGESPTVITSAMKDLRYSVYACVNDLYEGEFPGGQQLVFGADNAGVALAMDTARLETFTQVQYREVFARLVEGSISLIGDADASGQAIAIGQLPLDMVTVTVVDEAGRATI